MFLSCTNDPVSTVSGGSVGTGGKFIDKCDMSPHIYIYPTARIIQKGKKLIYSGCQESVRE